MSIRGIDQITYGVENREQCGKFFDDWGLERIGETTTRTVFETLNGCRVIVADRDAADLPAAFEAGPTLREVLWGVASDADLERLRPVLEKAEGFIEGNGRIGCTDPNGLAIRFQVTRKREVAVHGCPSNTWDKRERIDQRGAVYERARPIEVGHVVLFVTDVARAEAFYTGLGFVASDRYPGRGAFMRCEPRGGHHDLFMLQLPNGKQGLNHVAFTVRDIHEVFGGGLHIDRCGWKTQLGPGRHPISSAYFWYFKCPAGGLVEYYADEDELTGNWQPRDFEPSPTAFAEWAVDGGLDGHTRRQHEARAGGKFLTEKRED
jgi:catechol 2,3-dioxygenase-like lactoylglutathione lyase family enzyme